MTALEIAGLVKDYGLVAAVAILSVVVVTLYRELRAGDRANLKDRDQIVTALVGATQAQEKVGDALDAIRDTLAASKDANGQLAKLFEMAAQENRHGIANLQSSVNAIGSRLDRGPDRSRDPEWGREPPRGR